MVLLKSLLNDDFDDDIVNRYLIFLINRLEIE